LLIGIDLNSHSVALCLLPFNADERGQRASHLKFSVKVTPRVPPREHILGELYRYVAGHVFPQDVVYVEAPILAGVRNIQSTIKVAAAYGAVLAAVNSTHARVVEVPVALWKVATQGKGNASKDDVAEWLHATHPDHHTECGGDQDLVDATCIALYGELTERSALAGARQRPLLHQAS
jgi:Holliday junction resolvasome RuvABC endonuclease subunit